MNDLLTFLTRGRVTYAEGWDSLLKLETYGVVFALVAVAIPRWSCATSSMIPPSPGPK